MKKAVSLVQRTHAKRLRAEPTIFERRLWRLSRDRLPWAKFRRQVPIDRYVADFVCHEAKLVVELDGEGHGLESGRGQDQIRDSVLRSHGFTVLRFWNNALIDDADSAIETIRGALETGGITTPVPGEPTGRGFRKARRTRAAETSAN